jgi:hypothetical protein
MSCRLQVTGQDCDAVSGLGFDLRLAGLGLGTELLNVFASDLSY